MRFGRVVQRWLTPTGYSLTALRASGIFPVQSGPSHDCIFEVKVNAVRLPSWGFNAGV